MIRYKIRQWVFASVILSVSYGWAASFEIDLAKARQLALANNPGIKVIEQTVSKSQTQIGEARSGFFPTISAFSSAQHAWDIQKTMMPNFIIPMLGPNPPPILDISGMPDFIEVSFGMENTIVTGMSFNQPLFTGTAIWNGYQISKLGYRIAESQLQATRQRVLGEVTAAYYGALFAKSAVQVAEEALQSARENYERVLKFYNAGKSSRFDLLRAEVQVANFQPAVVSAQNGLRLAESQLAMMLNLSETTEFRFTESLAFIPDELLDASLADLIDAACRNRPEVAMMEHQQQIALRSVSLARASFLPSVIFGTNFQYQGQRNDLKFSGDDFNKAFNSSITVSIPVFSGLKQSSRYQQSKIAVREADYQRESLINGIKLEVKSAFFRMHETHENVMTQKKTIEQAEEALRLANLMYAEGSSTQLDVLNANLALNQARMNFQNSLYQYHVALAYLKKAIHML